MAAARQARFQRAIGGGIALALALLCARAALAEHADIELTVEQAGRQAKALDDTEPPAGGFNEIPILDVKAGEPATMQFVFVNVYPHRELPKAIVRYYITPLRELRQKDTAAPDDGHAIMAGKVTLPMKPKGRVGARLTFTLPQPGAYRVRVDTLNTQSDHEHFSAIDLRAE